MYPFVCINNTKYKYDPSCECVDSQKEQGDIFFFFILMRDVYLVHYANYLHEFSILVKCFGALLRLIAEKEWSRQAKAIFSFRET